MLAQETIRAIEEGCCANANASARITSSSANAAIFTVGQVGQNPQSSTADADAMNYATRTLLLPIEKSVDTELAAVEASKLEISSLEHQYSEIVTLLKGVEGECRKMRKTNEQLIREQKAAKVRMTTIDVSEAEAAQRNEEQVAELEQQIRDLTFYTRSKLQLAVSSLRDEIAGGSVTVAVTTKASVSGGTEDKLKDVPRHRIGGTKKHTTK